MSPREKILNRLLSIARTIVPAENAARNRKNWPESVRPVVAIYDGDESADDEAWGRKRPASAPNLIYMTPDIYIAARNDNGEEDDSGTKVNDLSAKILKAILTDEELRSLSHDGDIRYEGMATDFLPGRDMEGQSRISLTIVYVMRPDRL